MTRLEQYRRFYAQLIAAEAGVVDERIVDAFASVKREDFVGAGPWKIKAGPGYISTETDDPAILYQDILIGLDTERGINNGQPTLHAKSIAKANPQAGESVIHVGAGTGYYTAILSQLAGVTGRVHAYEIDAGLAERARHSLSDHKNVTVHVESALEASLPPSDVVYVSAGATHVPLTWLNILNVGGRLVIPLVPNDRLGFMLVVTKRVGSTHDAEIFSPAYFIQCTGARDDTQSERLATALENRAPEDVRSLRLDAPTNDSLWCAGNGYWLSTAQAP